MEASHPAARRRRIYLMRHGHVDYFSAVVRETGDIHSVCLSPRGISEAQAAGRALAHIEFDRAVCSGLPRTRETAEMVLAFFEKSPELRIDSDLIELRGGKLAPVKTREELIALMNSYFARAHLPGATNHEGGEVFAHAQSRAVMALERLLAEVDWKTALVVAHEGINRLLLSWACNADLLAISAFEQDTGCINIIDFDYGGLEGTRRALIKAVNLTPHNYLKHGMNMTSLEAIMERGLKDMRV
jgi:broad specificity phosphatase PhoE